MEIIRKKEIRLSTFFLRFLIATVLSGLIAFILWIALLTLAIGSDIIIPANRIEQSVQDFTSNLDSGTVVTADMIPQEADYAIYSKTGALQETNLSDELLENAGTLLASDKQTLNTNIRGRVFSKTETDQQIIIFSYCIRATFTSPALRHLFPNADLFEIILFFLLLITGLILVITHYARKFSKELLVMQDIADQIGKQNLDFTITRTRIRELNHVIDAFDHMRTELAHSLKEQWHIQQQKKKQMSALAHDIKTPLTIVRGNAELLQETNLSAEQNSYNHFILQNTEQIQDYVTKMIEMAKDREELTVSSSVLFADFLNTLLENTTSLGQKKDLTIRFLPENLPKLLPFPEESMKRILTNLLDNAIHYSPVHGTVTLHAYAAHALILEISDEGCGFSSEALKHGTEEFYQADESRGSRTHFGMGLAITNQLVTSLGGTLSLGNRPDGGAVVTVELPLNEDNVTI